MVDTMTRRLSIKKDYTEHLKSPQFITFLTQRYKIQKWPPLYNSTKKGRERIHLHGGISICQFHSIPPLGSPDISICPQVSGSQTSKENTLLPYIKKLLNMFLPCGNNVTRFFHSHTSDNRLLWKVNFNHHASHYHILIPSPIPTSAAKPFHQRLLSQE